MRIAERSLLDSERRWLRRVNKPQRVAGWRLMLASVALILVFGILAVLTLTFTGANWPLVLVFWTIVGVSIGMWAYFEEQWRGARFVRLINDALARDKARVTQIRSRAVIEIEQEDDEGAVYAFQVADREILFVSGQEFYNSARFPNADFAIVEVLGASDTVVGTLIQKRGEKLPILRKISYVEARCFLRPRHMDVIEGSLSELEHLLSNHSSRAG